MKKKKVTKIGAISSSQLFQAEKPRYNAFQCGTGAQGDTKYNRRKAKKNTRREIAMYV